MLRRAANILPVLCCCTVWGFSGSEHVVLNEFVRYSPSEFYTLLELRKTAPPTPAFVHSVVSVLPREGEVPLASQLYPRKVKEVEALLRFHRPESTTYLIKVVDAEQARLAIHARFVILIGSAALRILSAGQLQALVAHELAHEYVWDEYQAARNKHDLRRMRELELFCDGIALVLLARMGAKPSNDLIDALCLVENFDRSRGLLKGGGDTHPNLHERVRFAKEIARWLRGTGE